MNRKICVVTGSRAEYGLLRWIMQGIKEDPDLTLQTVVTGMHLSPQFGLTFREIEQHGFIIDRKVEMLVNSDSAVGTAKSMGLGLTGFADALDDLKPDVVVVLGDRFEIFSAVAAALVAGIPVAHIHGGETTEGAFDEALRHSITKMSQLHFVAAQAYRTRVIQLGEHPDNVFLVGGLGIDCISRLDLLSRAKLEASLGLTFAARNLLVTFHPVTLERSAAEDQMRELLAALGTLVDTQLIFTLPNSDAGGLALIRMVEQFVAGNSNAKAYASLGQLRYLSCIAQVDGVVGNSSSGLLEVPYMKKGTVNIGDRQKGRLQAASVINCVPERQAIEGAIAKMYTRKFQDALPGVISLYGEAGASEKVLAVVKHHALEGITKKAFHDLPQEGVST